MVGAGHPAGRDVRIELNTLDCGEGGSLLAATLWNVVLSIWIHRGNRGQKRTIEDLFVGRRNYQRSSSDIVGDEAIVDSSS
jgi:hypothetical protein